MQKLKGEYIHSFNTLNDFDTDMKPVIDEYRTETLTAQKEELRSIYEDKKREEFRQEREAENVNDRLNMILKSNSVLKHVSS
jgi:hypothetical protein